MKLFTILFFREGGAGACSIVFCRDFGINSSSMSAVNRHRERFPGTMSNDDLKKQEGDFATNCGNPMEGDSKSVIQNLQLLKQAVLTDTNKNFDDSYDNKLSKIAGT